MNNSSQYRIFDNNNKNNLDKDNTINTLIKLKRKEQKIDNLEDKNEIVLFDDVDAL